MSAKFNFTYIFCNNLQKMEDFYTDVLMLELIWKSERDIAYMIDGHQFLITLDENLEIKEPSFSKQPGWEGGTASRTSWSFEYEADDFKTIVENCKNNPDIITNSLDAQWQGYWSFPILDPMNNTIEITCTSEEL